MKANVLLKFGNTENFVWRDVPTPVPAAGEVLVRINASGINLSDITVRAGTSGMDLALPLVLGSEAAGVVEALGEGVTGLTIGQRVLAAPFAVGALGGGYATHICLSEAAVFALPDEVSEEVAVALGVAGVTAAQLVRQVSLEGRVVVIHAAAGGVGNILLQLVRPAGANTVIATVGDMSKAASLDGLGADHVLNSRADWAEQVKALTGGRGPDVIFDAVGGDLSRAGLAVLAPKGHIVAYGGASGTYTAVSASEMGAFVMKCQTLVGYSMMPMLMGGTARTSIKANFDELYASVMAGTLNPLVGQRFTLDRVDLAHQLLESRKSIGKIILAP